MTGSVVNSDFREYQPGVFLPTRSRRETYADGKLISVRVTTLSNVVVNSPINDSVFTLPPIPNGTPMQDNVLGHEILVSSDWRPIGKPTSNSSRSALASGSSVDASGEVRTQSTSEPTPTSRWLLLAAALGLLVAAALFAVRRLRTSSKSAD